MNPDTAIMMAIVTAVVLVAGQLARVLRAMMLHRTIRKGIEHNSNLTPELFDKIEEPNRSAAFGDDRIGLVLIALGLAILCYGFLTGDADDIHNMSGISLFPIFVGAALLGRFIYNRRAGVEG
jgi:hypothetical protein